MPGLIAGMESRFETHNRLIEEMGYTNIVDLPCGFEPRGPRYARKGMQYYGMDLPAVISRVEAAASSVTEEEYRSNLHFCSVDATNYDSLRAALKDVQGEIVVTTEGMLMYFNDSELKTVCENIKNLLAEFGGCWITFDRFSLQHTAGCMIGVLGKEAMKDLAQVKGAASSLSDFNTSQNILFAQDDSAVLAMLDEVGLTVERVPFTRYSADLQILKKFPEGTMDRVNQCLAGVELWIMRAKEQETWERSATAGTVQIDCKYADGKLDLALTGRLDSLNAPQLLQGFETMSEEKAVKEVAVHMKDLEYISSAGLRTLLIIYKKMKGAMVISDCSDSVKKILEMTGFAEEFRLS